MKTEQNVIEQKAMELISRVVKMVEHLPKESIAEMFGKAVIRSSTSAGIHYSDATKAKTGRQFIRDMQLMESQLNQTDFWLKMIESTNFFKTGKIDPLKDANTVLTRMVSKSLKTASENQKKATEARKKAKLKVVAAAK